MKKNEIYYSENEIINKQNTKTAQTEEYIYKNIFLCPLNKNDCVNSMDIFDDMIIYGTIMGNVYLCRVDKNNLKQKKKKQKNNNNSFNINNNLKSPIKNNDKINEIEYNQSINNKNNKKDEDNTHSKISSIKIKKFEKNIYNDNFSRNNNIITFNSNNKNDKNNEETKKEKITNDNKNINISNDSNRTVKEVSSIIKKGKEDNSQSSRNDNSSYSDNNENNNIEDNDLPFPQVTNLIINASENISCVVFDTKDNVIISVGDLEIIKLEKISTFNINDCKSKYDYTRVRNYISEEEHIINCENCTCFLTSSNYLMINTYFEETNSPITMQQIPYKNKILNNLDIVNGNIEMFNFCVPFDFDGDKFLFLDYQTKNSRRICIYYTIGKIKPFVHKINNDFGHISHMKLLCEDRIFLCRKYTQCEIYKINEDFTLLEEWKHIGEEVIAAEIYVNGTKISNNILNNENEISSNNDDMEQNELTKRNSNINEKEIKINYNINLDGNKGGRNHKKKLLIDYHKINNSSLRELQYINKWNSRKRYKEENFFSNNSSKNNFNIKNREEIEVYKSKNKFTSKSKNKDYNSNFFIDDEYNSDNNYKPNFLKLKIKDEENNINKNIFHLNNEFNNQSNISVVTLDINGNLNLYKNRKNNVIFNLYKIQGIEQKYKDEEFFSVGFPYFVIMNSIYFGISTDHGIFVITKCKK